MVLKFTAICNQAQTANVFSCFLTFESCAFTVGNGSARTAHVMCLECKEHKLYLANCHVYVSFDARFNVSLSSFQILSMNMNKFGRSYISGKPLDDDYRRIIIEKILAEGGERFTGYISVSRSRLAESLCISVFTLNKVWKRFCDGFTEKPYSSGGSRNCNLTNEDLELIEVLKNERPSISLSEISDVLTEMGNAGSISAISRAIKTRMPSGKQYSRKKLTLIARERFHQDNILYTQLFIDYLSAKNPGRIKFFDESGIKLPNVGTRLYGHSAIGMRSVELVRKRESRNMTLNLLVSLTGPEYFNLVDGATNTVEFLNFFSEAAEVVNVTTGRPALDHGDIIVMDNLAVHHFDGGDVLEDWLAEMGIELVYTPVYSPDLNPIESCFGKVKAALNGDLLPLVHENLKLATAEAIETITSKDMAGFYRHTSYLFV